MADDRLVAAALPRSTWQSLLATMVQRIAELIEEAVEAWDPEARAKALDCAEDHALRALPVLLEAVGPGPGEGYPEPSECRRAAEEVWRHLGAWPGPEEWECARRLVRTL